MLFRLSIIFFLFLQLVVAEIHNAGKIHRHHDLAHRSPGDIQVHKRDFTNVKLTYYTLTSVGACGQSIDQTAFTVALDSSDFGDTYPSQYCFKSIVIEYGGQQTTATIADECEGCPSGGLDLTQALFIQVAGSLGPGHIQASWYFADDPPTTPTPTPTPTPTSTYVPPPPPTTSTYVPPPPPPPPPPTSTSTSVATSSSYSSPSTSSTSTSTPITTSTSIMTSSTTASTLTVYTTSVSLASGPAANIASAEGVLNSGFASNINALNEVVVNLGSLVAFAAAGDTS